MTGKLWGKSSILKKTAISSLALITDPTQHEVVAAWHSGTGYPGFVYYEEADFLKAIEQHDDRVLLFVGWDKSRTLESESLLSRVVQRADPAAYIVSVSDSTRESDIVRTLNAGADRYIDSRLSFRIVNALIHALIRVETENNTISHFPPYVMNQMTREVEVEGTQIRLTPGEFRIARYLFEHSESVLSREVMLREVWGLPNLHYNRRVDTKISHIRKKMYLDGTYGWKLRYPRGQGYQLMRDSG